MYMLIVRTYQLGTIGERALLHAAIARKYARETLPHWRTKKGASLYKTHESAQYPPALRHAKQPRGAHGEE